MPSLSIYVTRDIYRFLDERAGKNNTPEKEANKWIEERYKIEKKKRGLMKLEEEDKKKEDGKN